jgi:hypothetical protein
MADEPDHAQNGVEALTILALPEPKAKIEMQGFFSHKTGSE